MAEALSEMEVFVNNERGIDPIVKAALVHYQFETIHPFLLDQMSSYRDGSLPSAPLRRAARLARLVGLPASAFWRSGAAGHE